MTETDSAVAQHKIIFRLCAREDSTVSARFSVHVPFKVDHLKSSMLYTSPQYANGVAVALADPCIECFCPELNATLAASGPNVWSGEETLNFDTLKSFQGETLTLNFMSMTYFGAANGTVLTGAGSTQGLSMFSLPTGGGSATSVFFVRITFFGRKDMPI